MAEYLRGICERAEDGVKTGPIRFTASTEGIKRDGKELLASEWLVDSYLRNPVVLWSHDYGGRTLPIGKTVRLDVNTSGKLIADVQFDTEDEFAQQVESKYRRGYLNAVSVGWDQKGDDGNELLDISAVPVPGDPDALMERQQRALRALGKELLDELEPETEPEPQEDITPIESGQAVWRGVATAMGDLLRVDPDEMDEINRREIYNGLEKLYKRLGKTPPEYMTAKQLAVLSDEERRGLLLEHEPYESEMVKVGPELLDAVRSVIRVASDLEAKLTKPVTPDVVEDAEIKRQEEMAWRIFEALGGNEDNE